MSSIEGDIAGEFAPVRDAFVRAFEGRPTMGAALAIYVEGRLVVDLWGGVADERSGEGWRRDTPTVIFSCTKGLMSVLVAKLVEEGRLDYDAPVSSYWPEFAAAGKAEVTVDEALSHRAGLSAPAVDLTEDDIVDWQKVTSVLAAQSPLWTPGTGYAYHALTHGWLAGELVRRVTGLSPGRYFRELLGDVTDNAWIGRSADLPSAAHLQVADDLRALSSVEEGREATGEPNWPHRAMTLGKALPAALVTSEGGFNDRRLQAAEIPGAGGIATAEALAAIWSTVVGETNGVPRLLQPSTLAKATVPMSGGAPIFAADPPYARWGMGFQLDSEARRFLSGDSFGHDGAGGQVAFADPEARVGFAFVTNWMQGPGDDRATLIVDALREVMGIRRPDAIGT